MTNYELFHLSMKCIGVAFLIFAALIVIGLALSDDGK